MLATLASAAAAPPLAPPGAADAPTLDLYVGDERRATITTNFGTATEALAAAVLRAGDPNQTAEGRVVLAARISEVPGQREQKGHKCSRRSQAPPPRPR